MTSPCGRPEAWGRLSCEVLINLSCHGSHIIDIDTAIGAVSDPVKLSTVLSWPGVGGWDTAWTARDEATGRSHQGLGHSFMKVNKPQ